MKRLRGVAVGTGYFSQFHFDAWSRMDEVEMVAVCDIDQQRAQQAAATYGISAVYTDFAQMLDSVEPDFVDIITRPNEILRQQEKENKINLAILYKYRPLLFAHAPRICNLESLDLQTMACVSRGDLFSQYRIKFRGSSLISV